MQSLLREYGITCIPMDDLAFDAVHHNYIHLAKVQCLDFNFYTFSRLVSYAVKRGEQFFFAFMLVLSVMKLHSSPHALVATTIDCLNRGPDRKTWLNYEDPEYLFLTDAEKAIEREREVISDDFFNPDAGCLVYRSFCCHF
ncbi:hypothetical protein QUC31_008734 [Theobroma cacao]